MREIQAAILAGVALFSLSAHADESPVAPGGLSFNFALTSDYRFRGLSQTAKKPALQGGVDYAFGSGAYVGVWASTVNPDQYPGSHAELDVYGGYRFEVAKDIGMDLGAIHIKYPGSKITAGTTFATSVPGTTGKADTTEIYAGLNYRWLSVKYNRTVGSSLFGIDRPTAGGACALGSTTDCYNSTRTTRNSGYLDLAANLEIGDKLTLNLHLGRQSVANYGNYSYSDWKVGLTKEIAGWFVAFTAVGTDAKDTWWYAQTADQVGTANRTKIGAPGIVLSVSRNF